MAEPLSPSDLSAIQAERGPVNMAVGGVVVVDGHVDRETIVERVRRRLDLIPRYRMRLHDVAPMGLAYPVWEEAADFDPADHIERVGVPAPGGDRELSELVGDVMSTRLDRRRPLWRMVVAQGLEDGRTAIIAAMHHALVDGVAAVNVGIMILDAGDASDTASAPEEAARRTALVEKLAGRAMAQLALPRRLVRGTVSRALALDPVDAARQARSAASVLRELAAARTAAPETRLNVPIGRRRSFAVARTRLDTVKAVKNATGTTVNDVILAAVSLLLGDYLGRGAPENAVALVPVSVRSESHRGELGNHISTVFVDLPLRGAPLARLRTISEQMTRIKASAQVRAGALLVGATGLAPPFISSLAVRAMSGPRLFNLVVSNVPGPQSVLFLDGKPVREIFPAVPLNPRNQALTIGLISYDGGIFAGLLGDRRALGDIAAAAAGFERAMEQLARLA